LLGVSALPLALGLPLQGDVGKGFAVVMLGHHAPLFADGPPFLDKHHAAEKIGLRIKPIEAAHVQRWIEAGQNHRAQNANRRPDPDGPTRKALDPVWRVGA
jgi:hypothetical protein